MKPLIPPDMEQCQTEITTSLGFMVLGGPPKTTERCKNKPTVLLRELKPGKDGRMGSMSLCVACAAVAQVQMADALADGQIQFVVIERYP